jgi:putative ABC transport system permease protein
MAAEARASRLPWTALVTLAARNIGRNKGRSGLSLAAIACGVAGLILSGGFVHDLISQLGEAVIHSQTGHIQIAKAGYFDVGSRSPANYLLERAQVRRVGAEDVRHVKLVAQRLAFSGLVNNGRSSYPIVGEGVEPDNEAAIGTYMVLVDGRGLSAKDPYGALVGAGVARAMNLRPGSPISLVAPTVDGAMNTVDLQVVGTFQTYSKDYDDRVVRVSLGTAQELLNTQGVNVLALLLEDTRQTARVARALRSRVEPLGLEVKTWDELNDFYWKTVALYDRQFGVLRLVVLIMVMLAVTGAINMGVLERTGEFGTMKALGNKRWDVVRLVVLEAGLMGLLGALIGLALGAGLGWLVSRIGIPMPPPPNSNLGYLAHIRLVPLVLAGAFLVGAIATVLASLPAAFRVSRLPIIEALRTLA